MRHAPTPNVRLIALALPFLLAFAASAGAQPTPTTTPNPTYTCARKITSGVFNFTTNYGDLLGDCETTKLEGDTCDTSLPGNLANAIEDLNNEVADCDLAGLDALCPLEGDIPAEVQAALTGASAESFRGQLTELITDVFTTSYASCPRPTAPVSSDALECAAEISDLIGTSGNTEELEKCFFSCERARILDSGLELCVDDVLGEPTKQDVIDCENDKLGNIETLEDRCTDATVEELGCPLGADTLPELKAALAERLATLVRELNLGIFHAECRGSLPGEPTEPVPATVTMLPSGTVKQLACGQTIGSSFMGGDTSINFDSDLNCGPARTATDGIIVATNRVKLNGRSKAWSIRGPQRSSLRTGVGIRLAPGVDRIEIRNFKAIENFGVGIQDADEGNNKKLVIVKNTVRRNIQAGLRIRSTRAIIQEVAADKNGIGFDLSGDGIKMKGSFAKGSLYPPKIGIQLGGTDKNLNGSIVVVSPLNTIELNQGVGIHVLQGAHVIMQNQVRDNLGDGILVDLLGVGSRIDSNTLKFNASGIVVNGDANVIESNACEENLGDGYLIAGTGNSLLNNGSGKKTDRGNGGAGYRITGASTSVETNEAEANLGSGFVVTGTPTTFSGNNTAQENHGHGFDIQSGGNTFEGCASEANNQAESDDFHEWSFVAGQSDGGGNKAGGDTIALPGTAGACDNAEENREFGCPLE